MVFSHVSAQKYLANYKTGQFKFLNLIPKQRRMENELTVIEGDEKHMFIGFISKILRWRPEERGTAEELLSDPWLQI